MQAVNKSVLENTLALVAIAAAYSLLVTLSVAISMSETGVATIWLANGGAAGLIQMRWRNRYVKPIAAVVAGGLLANYAAGIPFGRGLFLTSVSALEVWFILQLMDVFRSRTAIQPHPSQTLLFFSLLIFAPPLLSSVLVSSYSALFEAKPFVENLLIWWEVGAAGIALTVPLFLFWEQREHYFEQGLQRLLLIALWIVLFSALSVMIIAYFRFPYILIAVIFLIFAIQFDTFLTAVTGFVFAVTLYFAAHLGLSGVSPDTWEEANRSMATSATIVPALWLSFSMRRLVQAKAALFESRNFLSRVQQDSPIGMAMLNEKLEFASANLSIREMLGTGQDRIVGRKLSDFLLPAENDEVAELLKSVLREPGSQALRFERQLRRPTEETFWCRIAVSTLGGQGEEQMLIAQFEDIDENKRWQQKIEINNERWHKAFSSSMQGVWDADLRAGTTIYSENWCQLIGYTPEEIGDDYDAWRAYVHPDDVGQIRELENAHVEGKAPYFEYRFRMRHKDGHWVWILDRGQVIERGPNGEPLRMVGTHTDITDRMEAEAEVNILNERVRLATAAASIGLWEWRPVKGGFWWNDRYLECHGLDPKTFSGRSADIRARVHPDDLSPAVKALEAAIENNSEFDYEYRVQWDGVERRLKNIGRAADDGLGNQIFRGAVWDITEERQRVEELKAAKERESQFAAVASHDLQAPLRHIAIHSDMLARSLEGKLDDVQGKMINTISEKAQQAQDIIKGLLIFSRAPEAVTLEHVDLNRMLTGLIDEFQQDAGNSSAKFVFDEVPPVLGDTVLLAQVFQNIIGNALKYAGDAPKITVSGRKTGKTVELTICDDGPGIPAEYAEYVFQIFKRIPSAETRRGTGIGLSLCRRIVEAHKGTIWLDTDHGPGACFKMRLLAA